MQGKQVTFTLDQFEAVKEAVAQAADAGGEGEHHLIGALNALEAAADVEDIHEG